jgi:hypothetical protein
MSTQIDQDGHPYIPEPDDQRNPEIAKQKELHTYLSNLTLALLEYFSIQKTDADRLADAIGTPLSGTKVYYVSDTSGGAVTRKLTFVNGILTSET